jgi:hypothetical protein
MTITHKALRGAVKRAEVKLDRVIADAYAAGQPNETLGSILGDWPGLKAAYGDAREALETAQADAVSGGAAYRTEFGNLIWN